jgi:hypothetical protein
MCNAVVAQQTGRSPTPGVPQGSGPTLMEVSKHLSNRPNTSDQQNTGRAIRALAMYTDQHSRGLRALSRHWQSLEICPQFLQRLVTMREFVFLFVGHLRISITRRSGKERSGRRIEGPTLIQSHQARTLRPSQRLLGLALERSSHPCVLRTRSAPYLELSLCQN